MRVEARLIRKSYPVSGGTGFVTALDGADLVLAGGEFCLLHGPSGSGKSTLLAIIAGLARPTAGEILLDGSSGKPPRGAVSCAFQEPFFLPELTVLENLLLPGLRCKDSCIGGRGEYLLDEFGLSASFDLFPGALSGGEKRRLAIARALLCPSRLLLLDEPTAYLDEEWSGKIMALVMREISGWGATLLAATHKSLPGAEKARIAKMAKGKVS